MPGGGGEKSNLRGVFKSEDIQYLKDEEAQNMEKRTHTDVGIVLVLCIMLFQTYVLWQQYTKENNITYNMSINVIVQSCCSMNVH